MAVITVRHLRALVVAALLLLTAPPIVAPQEAPAPLTLDDVLALALARNPELGAARLRQAIDQGRLAVAREYPNPDLRYEREKEAPRDALTMAQTIEWPSKRSRRIAAAEAALRTGQAETTQAEAQVRAEVTAAFYQVADAQRRAQAIEELRALAGRAREAAAHRLEVGDVSRLDLLQAELALAAAENEAIAVEGELAGARADLNVVIGRDPATPAAVVDALAAVPAVDAEALALEAASSNAALAVLDRQIAESEANLAVARAERIPDPNVEGAVVHDAPGEFTWGWRFAVGVTIPLWTRHAGAVRVEESTLAQLRRLREATLLRVRGAVYAASVRAAAARRQYLRYRDEILPKSREVEGMAEESYREGQTGLPALLQSLQAARELRRTALASATGYETALAELRRAMTVAPQ
jgi:cobalt-zinc-cadmium efflux system outer membrane protein